MSIGLSCARHHRRLCDSAGTLSDEAAALENAALSCKQTDEQITPTSDGRSAKKDDMARLRGRDTSDRDVLGEMTGNTERAGRAGRGWWQECPYSRHCLTLRGAYGELLEKMAAE